ncbi:YdcF family protein [Ruminococcaceae bacterium OttesenSCG-928-O06]|nr:YdcF family protein [Ruminococcaceae bacterium OttesenSCG-928-O06]
MQVLVVATALFLAVFLFVYIRNKARLTSGFFFCLFLLSAAITYAFYALQAQNRFLTYTLVGAVFVGMLVLMFGIYVLVGLLVLNGRLMYKRERHTLANSLPFILAAAIVVFLLVSSFVITARIPLWVRCLWTGILLVLFFYFFHIFVFLVTCLLCNLAPVPKRQDYIVVLGARVIDGQPSPLLARRVDKAVRFYCKQQKKRAPPKLVFSGGQGADESVSEAAAMREYALKKGIPAEDILLEDKAENTWENMVNSKRIIEENAGGRVVRCVFATSNYHVLRSAMLARGAGIPMDGLGSKTALYYLPSALMREYIALFGMRKKWHVVVLLVLINLGALFALGMYLLQQWAVLGA